MRQLLFFLVLSSEWDVYLTLTPGLPAEQGILPSNAVTEVLTEQGGGVGAQSHTGQRGVAREAWVKTATVAGWAARPTPLSRASFTSFLQLKSPKPKAGREGLTGQARATGAWGGAAAVPQERRADPKPQTRRRQAGAGHPHLYERPGNFGCDGFCDRRFLRKDDKLLGFHWEASVIHGWINLKQLLDRPLTQK